MSLTREEKTAIYKIIHPELLIATLDALQDLEQKNLRLKSLQSLVKDNPSLLNVYGNQVRLANEYVKNQKEKCDSIQDVLQFYILGIIVGTEYSDFNKLRFLFKQNIHEMNVDSFNESIQMIKESKEFPTLKLKEEKNVSIKHFLQACDIFMHTDQEQLKKYSICRNIANLNANMISDVLKEFIPKIPPERAFFKGNKFAMNREESKQYPVQLLKNAKNSNNLLFKKIANGASIDSIKQIISDNLGILSLKDADQNTAIHIAIVARNKEVLKLLVDNGCDINARNCYGYMPLHLHIITASDVEMLQTLFDLGADPQASVPMNIDFFPKPGR
jgi:hypothetical protein